jgi:hypothetical protein
VNIDINCAALPARRVRKGNGTAIIKKRKLPMKAKSSHFDRLVARYYPAVYSFASRLTDDPREAIALTRNAFRSVQKQLCSLRDQTAVATIVILAVIRAGLAAGKLQAAPHFTPEFLPRERAKLPVLALRGFYMSNW